jgi:farnesyl-diphosphate farnesyltransferase
MACGSRAERDDLLREVARSFYLTLRVLPAAIRRQMTLAYLLARATDTVADVPSGPVQRRIESLRGMRRAIGEAGRGEKPSPAAPSRITGAPRTADDRLLECFGDLLGELRLFEEGDRSRIASLLDTICGGQELDMARFGSADGANPASLESDSELDDYTWRVAGCVGEFWTRMCLAHLFPKSAGEASALLADGIRYGKGLQLINILRDVGADLRHGRCYVPSARLAEAGLAPGDLLDPGAMPRFRPLYNNYLRMAGEHLSAGRRYLRALPWRQYRVRLACTLPLAIGDRTIQRLRTGNPLDPELRIKVPRREVRRVFYKSIISTLFGSRTPP